MVITGNHGRQKCLVCEFSSEDKAVSVGYRI